MTAPLLGLLGLACLALAAAALRAIGPGYRIARLLSATPQVDIAEANGLAAAGQPRYVRVSGRISSDEEFPDEHDRPLVYRRTRIEVAAGGGRWQTVTHEVEAVPFGIETRGEYIGVDAALLTDSLVVIPREALGKASDLDEDLRAGLPPDAPSRLVIEQISAVEHAYVAGVPVLQEGANALTAGLGRPLVMTTVELPAAMRLLATGRRRLVVAASLLLLAGVLLLLAAGLALLTGS